MTLSVADRRTFASSVLRTMALEVGFDRDYPSVHFLVSDPKFSCVPTTTWIELKDYKRIKLVPSSGDVAYRLTGSGWVAGLEAAGFLKGPEILTRAQAVVRTLKQHIDGRNYHHDPLIEIAALATASSQTEEWCYNAVHSGLLRQLFPTKNMNAYWDDSDGGVRVPATFGQEPIFVDRPTSA